ncbi:MAG: gas vesicle protein [Desulfomonilaceae bacterium]
MKMNDIAMEEAEHVSLCEALDRVLNKGAVIAGEVTISVANVDLIYLGLQVILASVDTIRGTNRLPFPRMGNI